MGGGAPSNTTSTSIQELPEWMQPYQQGLLQYGTNVINNQSAQDLQSPYGTVSPLNQAQQTANNMQIGRGLSGSPLTSAAQGYATDMLNGGGNNPYATQVNPYAGDNPYFQQQLADSNAAIVDAYRKGTAAQADANFSRLGTYGSSAWDQKQQDNANQLMGQISQNTNNLYGQQFDKSASMAEAALDRSSNAWQQMQQNRTGILGMANDLANQDYTDINNVLGAGDRYFQYQQSMLDEMNNNYQNQVNFPQQQLDQYLALLRGVAGNSGQGTVSGGGSSGNNAGMLAGLGMAGLGAMLG